MIIISTYLTYIDIIKFVTSVGSIFERRFNIITGGNLSVSSALISTELGCVDILKQLSFKTCFILNIHHLYIQAYKYNKTAKKLAIL